MVSLHSGTPSLSRDRRSTRSEMRKTNSNLLPYFLPKRLQYPYGARTLALKRTLDAMAGPVSFLMSDLA